jgi:hypothetical protein
MRFRFPDGIGDKYHFVSGVAKRSGQVWQLAADPRAA